MSIGITYGIQMNFTRGSPPISWENVCTKRKNEGLGIKNFTVWSTTLINKPMRAVAKKKTNLSCARKLVGV